jgi:ankyrin repeat protein
VGDRHWELPSQPNIEYYRNAAKDLLRAVRSGEPDAVERAAEVLGTRAGRRPFVLADAQHVLAQEHGFATWADFRRDVVRRRDEADRPVWRLGSGEVAHYDEQAAALIDAVANGDRAAVRRAQAHVPRLAGRPAALERRDARVVVAREYGFRTWRELVFYVGKEAGERASSPSEALTAAAEAVGAGDAAALRPILGRNPDVVFEPYGAGGTLLGAVTQPNVFGANLGRELGVDRRCVELLIAAGSELDRPLNLAACFNRVELVELLLDAGGAVDVIEPWGITPLMTAIYHGAAEAADVLARVAVVPDALWVAAGAGLASRVAGWFTESGALRAGAGDPRPNLADVGWPPAPPPVPDDSEAILGEALVFACLNGRRSCAELLMERGADVDLGPYLDLTPLHVSVMSDRPEMVTLLLDHGADLTIRDGVHGGTPLSWASHIDRPHLAELLRARGARE